MPLDLPNLDDRAYNDLVAEALTLIPAYSPEWTDHNATDPGITLIELLAYLTDMLLYRLNRVTDNNIRMFLKLLNGPDWVEPPNGDLRDEIRTAVLGVRERYRAVTKGDYEFLSTESFNQSLVDTKSNTPPVARAHCVPQRNLDAGTETDRLKLRPEHVSIVIVPSQASTPNPQPTQSQISDLLNYLDERRMLTTKLHVTGPFYAHVSLQLVIARYPDTPENVLTDAINESLRNFLNPLPSDHGEGWPFGRDVFVSQIYETLEKIPGIDFITDVMLTSRCTASDDKCVLADPIWHEEGDLIGLRIEEHHLPVFDHAAAIIAPSDAFVALNSVLTNPLPAFVIVNLAITAKAGSDPSSLKQAIKATVRGLFHPALGGPGPDTPHPTDIFVSDLRVAIKAIAGVLDPVAVVVDCVPDTALQQDLARGPFLHVEAGQVVDWRTQVQFS